MTGHDKYNKYDNSGYISDQEKASMELASQPLPQKANMGSTRTPPTQHTNPVPYSPPPAPEGYTVAEHF